MEANLKQVRLGFLILFCFSFLNTSQAQDISGSFDMDLYELKQLDKAAGIIQAQKLGFDYAKRRKYKESKEFYKVGGRWCRVFQGRGKTNLYYLANAQKLLTINRKDEGFLLTILSQLEGVSDLDKNKTEIAPWTELIKKVNSRASQPKVLAEINALAAKYTQNRKLVSQLKRTNLQSKKTDNLQKELVETNDKAEQLEEELVVKESKLFMKDEAISDLSAEAAQQQVRLQQQEISMQNQKIALDSLFYQTSIDSLKIEKEKEVAAEAKKSLLSEKKQKTFLRYMLILACLLLGGIVLFYFRTKKFNKVLKEQKEIISVERAKSDDLLANILPTHIANELKKHGKVNPSNIQLASVLFADFVGFSAYSKSVTTKQLVTDLHDCFSRFDSLTVKHGVEKIKTIGDAYMCASGLFNSDNGALPMIDFAMDMIKELKSFNQDRKNRKLPELKVRIGIHTGPLASGVVGQNKFSFDIWGDTVNIAARMESQSEANTINVSHETAEFIKSKHELVARGKVSVKNMADMEMYFIKDVTNG